MVEEASLLWVRTMAAPYLITQNRARRTRLQNILQSAFAERQSDTSLLQLNVDFVVTAGNGC
jgi:hypothetical protein